MSHKFNMEEAVKLWYGLDALRLTVAPYCQYGNHRHTKWLDEVTELHNQLTEKLASIFRDYFPCALVMEAKHSIHKARFTTDGMRQFRDVYYSAERLEDISVVQNYSKATLIEQSRIIFSFENNWYEDFGGIVWNNILEQFLWAENHLSNQVFVDWVIDLSHNTGSFLNKKNSVFRIENNKEFKRFLDIKRNYSLLLVMNQVPISREWCSLVTRGMLIMFPGYETRLKPLKESRQYADLLAVARWYIRGKVQNSSYALRAVLNYEPLKWGQEELATNILYNPEWK